MYTLEQIFEALGKAENGGAMAADLQNLITGVRNEAAANRVEKNKVLDALGLRSSDDPQSALNNLRTALEALKKTGNPEALQVYYLQFVSLLQELLEL